MTIDINALSIEAEELNTLKIRSNGLVLESLNKFLDQASPLIGITLSDVMEIFGAKEGKYPNDLVEQAAKYSLLTDEEKETYQGDKSKFDEILKYKKDGLQNLIQSPIKIIQILIKDGIKDGQPVELFDEFLSLLALAIKQDKNVSIDEYKSRLFMSDYDIWAEIFIRIIIRKQVAANKSFLLTTAVDKLIKSIPLLNFMKTAN